VIVDLMSYISGIIVLLAFMAKIFTCRKCIVVYGFTNSSEYNEDHSACDPKSKFFLENPTVEKINKQKDIYSYLKEDKCTLVQKIIKRI
jgi:hypothetical protein